MDTLKTCQSCGKPLAPDTPRGLCPVCLMKAGLGTVTGNPTVADAALPSPAEVAPHFPNLEIGECLGRGGMGVVYKARQPKLNRFVALKILAPDRVADPKFTERFLREAQALARLNHPHIVAVHDFGEVEGLYYLVMEYVDGVSLRTLLVDHKIKPEQAIAIVPKICEALQYAHEQGVVHRDIKPENVLLDKQGRLKIADFGIAKIVGGEQAPQKITQDQQVVGTPLYMAPEQVETPLLVDHRADIYSLGVVFYEMLTGELPLGRFEPPSKRVHVDVRLDEVVLHALEKKPERRYQHANEVKSDVETIVAHPDAAPAAAASKPVFFLSASLALVISLVFAMGFGAGLVMKSVVTMGIFLPGMLFGSFAFAGYVPLGEWKHFSKLRTWPRRLALLCWNASGIAVGAGIRLPSPNALIAAIPMLMISALILDGTIGRWLSRLRGKEPPPPRGLLGKDLPLVIALTDRRHVYWPGVLLFCSSIGLVVGYTMLVIALVMSLVSEPTRYNFEPAGWVVLMVVCIVMRFTALILSSEHGSRMQAIKAALAWKTVAWKIVAWSLALVVTAGILMVGRALTSNRADAKSDTRELISETIRNEVGRQLRNAGATYDDLKVTVAVYRDSATPFKVVYRGLQGFKGADGTVPAADGEFIIHYIGGGQWQGVLAGTQFTVSVGSVDNIALPFVDDPQVIGKWESVDFVANPSEFNPVKPKSSGDLFLKELTFLGNGKTAQPWWTWTKGFLIHRDNKTASRYRIQEINGQSYMFLEWKSGDVVIAGMKPKYYVLRRTGFVSEDANTTPPVSDSTAPN